MSNNNLKFETVGAGLYVCTSPDHKFGTDSFLIANFAAPRNKDIVCDYINNGREATYKHIIFFLSIRV